MTLKNIEFLKVRSFELALMHPHFQLALLYESDLTKVTCFASLISNLEQPLRCSSYLHLLHYLQNQNVQKNVKKKLGSFPSFFQILYAYLASFALAASARAVKAVASFTAKSASILRFTSISANFKPCINCE